MLHSLPKICAHFRRDTLFTQFVQVISFQSSETCLYAYKVYSLVNTTVLFSSISSYGNPLETAEKKVLQEKSKCVLKRKGRGKNTFLWMYLSFLLFPMCNFLSGLEKSEKEHIHKHTTLVSLLPVAIMSSYSFQ